MQFDRMRIAGFKSFVEPTELLFEEGLTGVVGPNGCGKSNLVEALRWAMGETSARQVRGSEMDDVIFSGAANRPPRNLAEVILTLDNSDRRLPAQFNDSDQIEVARRIERGHGSAYRVNGVDVRARDVQTLFADAASGARSMALVSQGRVGAIIAAKPTERRALLEEAAGISGLHARRHEAELRLRAAEANLERLEDVIGALEEQHRQLKRQARQATRYRNLSDHIRRHEAILLHLRWTAAGAEKERAAEEFAAVEAQVAERTRSVAAAATAQANASTALPGLRNDEAEAAAALQRLTAARNALDAEERRIDAARNETATRIAQIDGDAERERGIGAEAKKTAAELETEAEGIETARRREAGEIEESGKRLANAEQGVGESERTLAELMRSVVADETREAALKRQLAEFGDRRKRLDERLGGIAAERRAAEAEADDDGALDEARRAVSEARRVLEARRAVSEAEETRAAEARAADNDAREAHQAAETAAAKLRAEKEALTELLEVADPQLWPPMIDAVAVQPGYEVALGAALGDDLVASSDEASPVHWRNLPALSDAPELPEGVEVLGDNVAGPPGLARRLSQIGVVGDDEQGWALFGRLAQGQRLVSKNGALWRWDGFTATAGAPTAAATRLAQRNRLEAMRGDFAAAERCEEETSARREETGLAAQAASERERAARTAAREADEAFQKARDAASSLAEKTAEARSRVNGLIEAGERIGTDLTELADQEKTAREQLETLSDVGERRSMVERRQRELAERRARLTEARSAHDRLSREAASRAQRLKMIANELQSWRNRSENAAQQLDRLAERRALEVAELDKLRARPREIAEERTALLDRSEAAEKRRNEAADALAVAETQLDELTRDLRRSEARLAETREERIRKEAAIGQVEQKLAAIAERVAERLECSPENALASVGLSSDEELPPQDAAETKLERLQRERDNMGPVNLRAEPEAAELDGKIRSMEAERGDLTAAISKLRHGISGLNREGRERLLAAFTEVDEHFRELFGRLFGGGRAHLQLTEAADPLEAGLEVYVSPPGKRLQSMTLLSGGEQALTALALLFAVFLTNPAPVCVLDEVDAPLDDSNVDRFCALLDEMTRQLRTRYLLVTHHRLTMARMDRLYGVTMAEPGVSQIVSVDLQTAERLRQSA